ncbi:MAG: MFS transporter [archaeon]|nr:MFS transporter [archaeon]
MSRALRTFPFGFLAVLLPIYLAPLGAYYLGLFFSFSFVSSVFLLLILSVRGNRIQMRIVLIVQSIAVSVTVAILASTKQPLLIIIASLICLNGWGIGGGSGSGSGPYGTAFNVSLIERSDVKSRTEIISLGSMIGSLSFSAGAYFLNVIQVPDQQTHEVSSSLSRSTIQLLFVISIVMFLAAIVPLLFTRNRLALKDKEISQIEPSKWGEIVTILRRSYAFLIAEFLNGLGNSLYVQLLPLWMFLRFGISVGTVGQIFAVAGAITAFMILFSPKLETRIGSIRAISFARVCVALALVGIAFAPIFAIVLVLYFSTLILSRISSRIQQSLVFRMTPEKDWSRTFGSIGMVYLIGATIGPVIGAFLLLDVNSALPFLFAFPLILISGLVYWIGYRAMRSVSSH